MRGWREGCVVECVAGGDGLGGGQQGGGRAAAGGEGCWLFHGVGVHDRWMVVGIGVFLGVSVVQAPEMRMHIFFVLVVMSKINW